MNSGNHNQKSATRRFLISLLTAGASSLSLTLYAEADDATAYDYQNVRHETIRKIHHDKPATRSLDQPQKIAADLPLHAPVIPAQDPLPKPKGKLTGAVTETTIKAPVSFVWETLTDFPRYPQMFNRIDTCKVTRRDGNYVYTESYLKPQMFIHERKQIIVNDLSAKPNVLRWAMIHGNFDSSQGCWELTPDATGKYCKLKYTLESTCDPIPRPIFNFTLKIVQKDIVKSFKKEAEELYQAKGGQNGKTVAVATP